MYHTRIRWVRTDPSFGHDIFGQTGDLKVFLRRWIVDSWYNIRNVLGPWDVSFHHPSMGDWTGSSSAFWLRISEAFGLWHQSSVNKSAMVSHWLRVLVQIPTRKLTGRWKIHHEWRDWRSGFSNVMLVLSGVLRHVQGGNEILEHLKSEAHLIWLRTEADHHERNLSWPCFGPWVIESFGYHLASFGNLHCDWKQLAAKLNTHYCLVRV